MSASPAIDMSQSETHLSILVVSSDDGRGRALSQAVSRATDADTEVLVRGTVAAALDAVSKHVDLCIFDLSDPARLDLEACLIVIRRAGGRRVIVVASEEQTSLAVQAVFAGAYAFQPLGAGSGNELERTVRRALDPTGPADVEAGDPPARVDRLTHDLNNVLSGILGLVDMLGRERNLSSAGKTRITDLRRTAKRGVQIVTDFTESRPRRSESEPGAGTTFEILLQRANETTGPDSTPDPAAPAPRDRPAPPRPAADSPQGTVLLVEDDDVLRATYEELLRDQGLQVIGAADGFNALLQASTHPGRIDLLVSDILLPQMSGIELWRKLSRFRPEAQVLFITGNLNQARVMIGQAGGSHHLLGKPFTATALLETVRTLLASSPFVRPGSGSPA